MNEAIEETNGENWTLTADRSWTLTSFAQPPEGKVVQAMDSGGHVQPLKRSGRLWFLPDGSMYVYFTPKMWRAAAPVGSPDSPAGEA